MASLIEPVAIVRKAQTLRDISRVSQALAICKLIADADVQGFRENLIRSGQARRYYLAKSREEESENDRFLGLSRVEAIMDAFVAGDLQLARDIASLSIDSWHEGWEYEDDFCYYSYVHGVIEDPGFADRHEAHQLLKNFERALDGQGAVRLTLCKALSSRDASEFQSAFERLISEFGARMEEKRAASTEYTSDAAIWPRSFVCIEALAWLAIGRSTGLELHDQYRFCPAEARGPFIPLQVPDLFQSLDEALREG